MKGRQRKAFFTGGNSSCQAHIRSHYPLYQQRCKEQNIPENHYAIPQEIWRQMKAEKLKPKGKQQVKLDGILVKEAAGVYPRGRDRSGREVCSL